MQETRAAKDLAIGDVIQVDGFEDNQVVRTAKKIRQGLDAGLFEVTLVAADGETERIALAPENRVTVVGKDPDAGKGKSGGTGKANAQAKAKPEPAAWRRPRPRRPKRRPQKLNRTRRRKVVARRRPRARRK